MVNGTEYFIVGAGSSEFQLSATSGGAAIALTALGTGTAHSFVKRLGATRQHGIKWFKFYFRRDQAVSGLVATPDTQDSHDLIVTLIDEADITMLTTVPSVNIKVTGTTATVLVNQLLNVGSSKLDLVVTMTVKKNNANAYDTPNFDIDNISLKKKTVMALIANAPINNKGMVVEGVLSFAVGAGSVVVNSIGDKENNGMRALLQAGDIELATRPVMQALEPWHYLL